MTKVTSALFLCLSMLGCVSVNKPNFVIPRDANVCSDDIAGYQNRLFIDKEHGVCWIRAGNSSSLSIPCSVAEECRKKAQSQAR